jgi:hypothetical protein
MGERTKGGRVPGREHKSARKGKRVDKHRVSDSTQALFFAGQSSEKRQVNGEEGKVGPRISCL